MPRSPVFAVLLQSSRSRNTFLATFRHLGVFGLILIAILDSSPVPTFGGPDLLVAILVNTRRDPFYEYAAAAAIGSTIGAYLTFRLARKAGKTYMESKFGHAKVAALLDVFQRSGTGALAASSAIPFPFPTSMIFAAAGASGYDLGKFLIVVAVARSIRYTGIAILADLYGRHIVRVILHPIQYWGWFLLFTALLLAMIGTGILVNRRILAGHAR